MSNVLLTRLLFRETHKIYREHHSNGLIQDLLHRVINLNTLD